MKTIHKIITITGLLVASSLGTTANASDYRLCTWKEQPALVITSDPFHVTNTTGPTPVIVNSNPLNIGKSCLDLAWPGVGSHLANFMKYMENYSNEMDDWAEAWEQQEDMMYVRDKNANRTDDTAYVYLDGIKVSFDTDEDGVADFIHRNKDIVKGADTDNNGLIDILEAINAYPQHGNKLYHGQYG